MNNEPRAYTPEEVRDKLLNKFRMLVKYWANESRVMDVEEKLSGLAFSMLSTLDGSSLDVPAFNLVPDPHPDDQEYHRENGENWFEPTPLSFALHEYWHQ